MALLTSAVIALASSACFAGEPTSLRFRAGTVAAYTGLVKIRAPGGPVITLTKQWVGKPVLVGDRVLVGRKSSLTVVYRTGERLVHGPSDQWRRLELKRTKEEDALLVSLTGGHDPLNAATKPAVKFKGGPLPVVSDPKRAPIRFFRIDLPPQVREPWSVKVSSGAERSVTVYEQDNIRGSFLESSELRRALAKYRSSGWTGPLSVTVIGAGEVEATRHNIVLMDEFDETRLLSQLSLLSQTQIDGFKRALSRLEVLVAFGLTDRASRELAEMWAAVHTR